MAAEMQHISFQGTVAVTDHKWFEYLRSEPGRSEVNFWRPSPHRGFRAPEFSPFFFKLRAPHNVICGFGYFARYIPLPVWLAWECFEFANGFASLTDMQARLGTERIGCILIVQPTCFAPGDWIDQPADWLGPIQSDKRYDLARGEGQRIWESCLERVQGGARAFRESSPRYGDPQLVTPRLGQGTFRVAVSEAYGWGCAVSGEHSVPALDAAHIRPVADDGPYLVNNGLLLRADIHRLFDQGYMTVTQDLRVEVSARLREDYENGRSYYPFHGQQVLTPRRAVDQPSAEFLRWHNESRYKG